MSFQCAGNGHRECSHHLKPVAGIPPNDLSALRESLARVEASLLRKVEVVVVRIPRGSQCVVFSPSMLILHQQRFSRDQNFDHQFYQLLCSIEYRMKRILRCVVLDAALRVSFMVFFKPNDSGLSGPLAYRGKEMPLSRSTRF